MQTSSSSAMYVPSSMTSFSRIPDSGASHHITPDATQLVSFSLVRPLSYVCTADGTLLSVTQCGRLIPTSTAHSLLALADIHHFPGLILNLISVSQLHNHGLTVTFISSACALQDHHAG